MVVLGIVFLDRLWPILAVVVGVDVGREVVMGEAR
jgi:hypothetical protein